MAAQRRRPVEPRWMRCWICEQDFFAVGKAKGRVCLAPRCQREAARIRQVRYFARKGKFCIFCDASPLPNRRVCERHQFRKGPCRTPGCTDRVPYTDGQGNKREYCLKCRPQMHRPPPRSRVAREATP